jgi:hypothetical protein
MDVQAVKFQCATPSCWPGSTGGTIAGYVEEAHRLYNKRATGQRKAMERDSGAEGAGQFRCRYFRGTDTWEALQQEQHSEESAAAVSNMQQRQSAGSAV